MRRILCIRAPNSPPLGVCGCSLKEILIHRIFRVCRIFLLRFPQATTCDTYLDHHRKRRFLCFQPWSNTSVRPGSVLARLSGLRSAKSHTGTARSEFPQRRRLLQRRACRWARCLGHRSGPQDLVRPANPWGPPPSVPHHSAPSREASA